MVYQLLVHGSDQSEAEVSDKAVEEAVLAVAQIPRDIEGERLLAKLRREIAAVDVKPPQIGRFEVQGVLGAGAMGTVYLARDPELERDVAVKVLRDVDRDSDTPLREARALARLSHPNIVTVFEIGVDRGSVFVAMERVRGDNLRAWLADHGDTATANERLAMLVAAGRGLAAAHAEGLIHGDFKPDNILVGTDRVRVADFGLVKLGNLSPGEQPSGALTEQTTLAGTPAYMAPEQLAGEAATVACDQYAFAATLFETLTGSRPYSGRTVAELHAAIRRGELDSATLKRVPQRLRPIIQRALSISPKHRYPSMRALLRDLDRAPRKHAMPAWAALAPLLAAAIVAYAYFGVKREDPCSGASTHIAGVWDASRAARVKAAFAATGIAQATTSFVKLDDVVQRYLNGWQRAYRTTCEATHLRREQSNQLLDIRMACLKRRLAKLASLSALFEQVRSGKEMLKARAAIQALPDVGECTAAQGVPAEEARPNEVKLRQQVDRLVAQIDRGQSLYALGRYGDAKPIAKALEAELKRVPWPAAQARGWLFVGSLRGRTGAPGEAEPRLQRALKAAAKAGTDRLSWKIWRRLLKDQLFAGHHQRVIDWSRFAKAAAVRGGGLEAEVDAIVGEAHLLAGRSKKARAVLKGAVDALTKAGAPGDAVAIALSNMGNAQWQLGDVSGAERSYRRALEQVTRELGNTHPTLSRYLDKLGRVARKKGALAESLALHQKALGARQRAFGMADRTVASSLLELSRTLIAMKRFAPAIEHLNRALPIREQAYGKDHLRLTDILQALGEAHYASGQHAQARTWFKRALTIRKRKSPAHPGVKVLECMLSVDAGKGLESLELCRRHR